MKVLRIDIEMWVWPPAGVSPQETLTGNSFSRMNRGRGKLKCIEGLIEEKRGISTSP